MGRYIRRRLGRVAPWWRRFKRNGYRREHCDLCGHPFRWSRDARHSLGDDSGRVWHQHCQAYTLWRRKADERLEVIGLMTDLSGLTGRDVTAAAELRTEDRDERTARSNRTWRAFYDLEKAQPTAATTTGGEDG